MSRCSPQYRCCFANWIFRCSRTEKRSSLLSCSLMNVESFFQRWGISLLILIIWIGNSLLATLIFSASLATCLLVASPYILLAIWWGLPRTKARRKAVFAAIEAMKPEDKEN